MKPKISFYPVILILVASIALGGCFMEKPLLEEGMPKDEVLLILGAPTKIEKVNGKEVHVYIVKTNVDSWARRITYDKKNLIENIEAVDYKEETKS